MGRAEQHGARQRAIAAARTRHARSGEDTAASYLASRGYVMLERNLRIGHDEADLIALTPSGAVAVIEVKSRRGPWHGEDRVNAAKRRNLLRLAAALATQRRFARRMFQFDVIAVEFDATGATIGVTHFERAFDASGSCW